MSESSLILSFWLSFSLVLAILTAGNDRRYWQLILILMIFGPIGRLISPGSLVGSLWAFDPLILFGLGIRWWQGRLSWPKRDLALWFLIFSLLGLVSSSFIFPFQAVLKASLYSWRWLAYYLTVKGVKETKGVNGTLLLVAVLLAASGLVQLNLLPNISNVLVAKYAYDPHVGRLFSTWFDPNYLGGFLVLALLVNLDLKMGKGKKGREGLKGIGGVIMIGLIGLAILLTYSRSSYLALMAGLLIYGLYKSPRLIVATIFGALLAVILIAPVRERISGVLTLDITAKARIESWQRAIEIIRVNPVVGFGYNLYTEADQALGHRYLKENVPYRPAASGSDSSLLNIWATSGIGGLIVYLLIIRRIWQNGTAQARAALVSLLVHTLFVNSLLLPPFMLVFWLMDRRS